MPEFPADRETSEKAASRFDVALLIIALLGLAAGTGLYLAGKPDLARIAWTGGVIPVLAALVVEIVRSLWKGEVGLDVVAALSMSSALVFGEALAAAVVALMYSGGTFLESFAEGRARREMHDLLSRVPRTATRHRDGALDEVPLGEIAPGDLLLIRQGDVAPVDGTVESERAVLDQSAMTGESMPVRLMRGQEVMSGSTNAGEAFDLRASRRAAESTHAGILFLVVTVALATAAWWMTADPIRAVAVLVVATPCPLILAVPVALVAGLSRAAHFGVLIKGARPLEALTQARTLVLDKTGTLTDGRPRIVSIETCAALLPEEVLYLAAAADQASKHPMAQAIVAAAHEKNMILPAPTDIREVPGEGVAVRVDGRSVVVGGTDFVMRRIGSGVSHRGSKVGSALVAVAVDGQLVGNLVLADPLRLGTADFLARVRRRGIGRILLATGDRHAVAQAVAEGLGFDGIRAELTPDQKVLLVLTERKNGPVMMVGDGVNDAPALAAADVGVAMGARGAAASAEAADVVLLVDDLGRLLSGLDVAGQSRRIALESVIAGIGLSVAGMVAAALGYLNPVQGALLQEAIDIAVILNALRALRISPEGEEHAGRSSSAEQKA
ncbi:MAG: HAD-IC family P-type ATPase [Rhizobiales bacterium]|nr:HAD-IC family P-type ATPase [Hyphomicrobiales bacterium]